MDKIDIQKTRGEEEDDIVVQPQQADDNPSEQMALVPSLRVILKNIDGSVYEIHSGGRTLNETTELFDHGFIRLKQLRNHKKSKEIKEGYIG